MSDKQRTTIWLSEPIQKAIENRKNTSQRIARICDRYERIVKVSSPLINFTEQEYLFLCDHFNGHMWEPASMIQRLSIYIDGEAHLQSEESRWKIDIRGLQERLNRLKLAETISLVEAIELFWTPKEVKKDTNWSEVLKDLGFIFKDSQ